MNKVVVIGGSGFIGSHTADELTRRGFKVIIFDREVSPWISDGQEMILGDVLDLDVVQSVVQGARYVYHFGGIANIEATRSRPLESINTNIMGAAIVLDAARQANVERFLYASTMYVYSPFGSFYRASKQAAEIIVESYQEHYDLEYTLLRYGSLYGPRAQSWNGLQKYVNQVVKTGRLEYPGTGNERREYIHVEDAARLSVDVLVDKYINQAITVTGSQVLTSNQMVDLIFEISGEKRNVSFLDVRDGGDHYSMTPYRYTPKQARKLVLNEFIDLGQGILTLVEEVNKAMNSDNEE